jgi:hypothetical protein
VLACARSIFGHGVDAEMTYYETPFGAKVFAAGAFSLAGLADSHVISRMLDNLFARMGRP